MEIKDMKIKELNEAVDELEEANEELALKV